MRAKRVDGNQAGIVMALRNIPGISVQHLHTVGSGCPDLLVGFEGRNYLFEIKTTAGKLNSHQESWHKSWQGSVHTVTNVQDILAILNTSICE